MAHLLHIDRKSELKQVAPSRLEEQMVRPAVDVNKAESIAGTDKKRLKLSHSLRTSVTLGSAVIAAELVDTTNMELDECKAELEDSKVEAKNARADAIEAWNAAKLESELATEKARLSKAAASKQRELILQEKEKLRIALLELEASKAVVEQFRAKVFI